DDAIDLVTANSDAGNVSVLLNRGDGSFEPAKDTPVNGRPSFVVSGDVNGDGEADLAVSDFGSAQVSVFFNQGSGGFSVGVNYAVRKAPYSVAIGDIDGDGHLALVTRTQEITLALL